MTVTTDQQTAYEKPVVADAWFVAMHFASGTQRVCNFNKTISWDGFDWLGLGGMAQIGEVTNTEKIEPNAVNLSLAIADSAWLAFAVGPVEEYRGLPAEIYKGPLTPEHTLIDDPVLVWSGDMDVVNTSVEGGDAEVAGSVTLRCEPESKRLRRRKELRVNAATQKQRYPTDTGFDYQIDLINNPQVWLSRDFQLATQG